MGHCKKDLPGQAVKGPLLVSTSGDAPEDEHPGVRETNDYLARAVESAAREFHLDFTSVVMQGTGHALSPKYEILLGEWTRGEKFPTRRNQNENKP